MWKGIPILVMPSHAGTIDSAAAGAFYSYPSKQVQPLRIQLQSSLLAHNFNDLWCQALNFRNERQHTVTHFAMIHADIAPEPYWLDTLVAELLRTNADVLSVVIPMKSMHGLTSTAVTTDDPWKLRRLTMTEVMRLPETFGATELDMAGFGDGHLVVNTGLWVCRFDQPWVEDWEESPPFHMEHRVYRDKAGKWKAEVIPEDWWFSRAATAKGVRVMATRKVRASHQGGQSYPNHLAWGEWKRDEDFFRVDGWRFPADVSGWLTPLEGAKLAELAAGKRVLEIGSYCGRSTICLAQTAASVTCVDPFDGRATPEPKDTHGEFWKNVERYGVMEKVFVCRATTETARITDKFDLVFIDGDHEYEAVKLDIAFAVEHLNEGGKVAFHDYRSPVDPGVTRAVDEWAGRGAASEEVVQTVAVVQMSV